MQLQNKSINKAITGIDFRLLGNFILQEAIRLSKDVNTELLEPISKWLDDPDFFEKLVNTDAHSPRWSEYKRRQRERRKTQRYLNDQRLKIYWREIRRKKEIRDNIFQILGTKSKGRPFDCSGTDCFDSPPSCINIQQIYEPFSQIATDGKELEAEFEHFKTLQIADILPWQAMLQDELKEPKTFSGLKAYTNKTREEKIAKFQHILMMQSAGQVSIQQTESFGDITIEPRQIHQDSDIIIKDRQGNDCTFVWGSLSNTQRNKIIADIQACRIICRSA